MSEIAAVVRGLGRTIGAATLIATVALSGGCGSTPTTSDGGSMSSARVAGGRQDSVDTPSSADKIRATLDKQYVVGPTAAQQLGYRISWNVNTAIASRGAPKMTAILGDSLFIVDAGNNLTRLVRESGNRVWSWPVGGAADQILGIARSTRGGHEIVMALTEGDLHVFSVSNGDQIDRQRLKQRVAATAPIVYGSMIIYGSLNGQIIWHHYNLNSFVRGSTLFGAISAPPVQRGKVVAAVTDRGEVGVLDAGGRGLIWRRRTRDPIIASPAISEYAVYVAGRDQFIRCYDVRNGEELWKRLHSEPLEQPPVVIGDNVYVQTDDLGLCCYEALPYEMIDGETHGDLDGNLLWNTNNASGTVIGRHRGNLLTWDDVSRTITLISERDGEVVETIHVPNARKIMLDTFDSGEIYAIGDKGGITRLVPRK